MVKITMKMMNRVNKNTKKENTIIRKDLAPGVHIIEVKNKKRHINK